MKRKCVLFLILAFGLMSLYAQTPTGTLQGIVSDTSGGAIPGVKVTITNAATNEVKALTTDASGHYLQPFLLTGTYVITVEKEGFRSLRQANVKLDVGQNRSVDLVLEVGVMTQQISVEGAPPAIDVNTSSIGQVIENKRIVDLPLNGRNPFALANLTPGVNPTGGGATPAMGGGRNSMSELQIDGMTNIAPENNVGINAAVYQPPVDSVAEFSVQVNSLAAEYGRFAGGVINVATKSGTNQLHGTVYDFLRNSVLDANDFFANKGGRAKGSFKRNDWGGTLSGPIVRDKTFFFASFEGVNARSQSIFTGTMPLDSWKNGDFSNLRNSSGQPIVIYDPLTVREDPANPGQFIRDPFQNNTIPTARQDAVARNMRQYWVAPNTTPSNVYTQASNYISAGSAPSNTYRLDAKVDHNWTDKWRTFVRFSLNQNNNKDFNGFGNIGTSSGTGPVTGGQRQVSLDNTYTFGPTLIGNFRYGFGRTVSVRVPYSDGIDLAKLGFPQSYQSVAAMRGLEFPRTDVGNGLSSLGQSTWTRLYMAPMVHSLTGTLTKITSRHTIKGGGEFRILQINFSQYGSPSGQYGFSNAWTQREINTTSGTAGFGLASFLLGLGGNGTNITHDPSSASSSRYFAGYIQDDWKATSKLTFNLGVRYDVDVPRTERWNRLSYFNLNEASPIQSQISASACAACGNLRGAMHFVGVGGSGRSQTPTDKNNVAPRLGFAYNFAKETVLRGGYGIAFAPSALQAAGSSGAAGMEGFNSSSSVNFTYDTMRTVYTYLANPYPAGFNLPTGASLGASTNLGLGVQDSFFDAYKNPYVQQWNMNLQHSFKGFVTEIGYMGNRGIGLVDGESARPYNQLPASYMAMGSALLAKVNNPFYQKIPYTTGALAQTTVEYRQLLRPYPQYTGLGSFRKPSADSIYHGMTVRADKRFSSGLSLLLAYTAGKLIDNASSAVNFQGPLAGTRLDFYNRRLDRSVSSMDVAQRAVISYVYELPFGKGKKFLSALPRGANMIVTGWQVNGITTFQSGTPIFILAASNNTNIYTQSQRPNATGSAKLSSGTKDARMNRWFDTSVFSQPAAYTFGTLSRTLPDVRNPGQRNTDLSAFKNTYFGSEQRVNLQYRCEMFNVFNTTQFGSPGNTVLSGNFGIISSTAVAPRNIQMALKLIW